MSKVLLPLCFALMLVLQAQTQTAAPTTVAPSTSAPKTVAPATWEEHTSGEHHGSTHGRRDSALQPQRFPILPQRYSVAHVGADDAVPNVAVGVCERTKCILWILLRW